MIHQKEFIETFSNKLKFNFFLLTKLPMAWLAGLSIESFDESSASISLRYSWLIQNPFKSIYFACLAMAGEMSTGLLVMMHIYKSKPSISMLVIEMKSVFVKKAVGKIVFTCADALSIEEKINLAKSTGLSQEIPTTSIGRNEAGEEVCRVEILWSVKVKST
ncbi:MAG: DUF4442 domain-containing protein [Chitinophagales bacterium]|nr:DUF4442 domain-containing protein [Chitinophagales bacterium]